MDRRTDCFRRMSRDKSYFVRDSELLNEIKSIILSKASNPVGVKKAKQHICFTNGMADKVAKDRDAGNPGGPTICLEILVKEFLDYNYSSSSLKYPYLLKPIIQRCQFNAAASTIEHWKENEYRYLTVNYPIRDLVCYPFYEMNGFLFFIGNNFEFAIVIPEEEFNFNLVLGRDYYHERLGWATGNVLY